MVERRGLANCPVVQVDNVEKSYRLGNTLVHALRGVSLSLEPGEFVVVMGPSGSGKTTLLNLIGTLDKPSTGRVLIDNEDISRLKDRQLTRLRRYKIGFIFQFHNLIPVLTALENVELPLQMSGTRAKLVEARARELLTYVGLKGRMNHLPDELSGGEQQRVAIARALANHPKIILADEPTGDLDTKTGSEVVQLMYDLTKRENAAAIIVTHDPLIARKAERLFEMRDGKINRETRPSLGTITPVDSMSMELSQSSLV
jgi:putative ABC transport system ATP-binding protein